MSHPWEFGWAQLLTIIGFVITALIAIGEFRSFERWRRERVEEKKIDTAVDTLVLLREMKLVFENIRSPGVFEYEWEKMLEKPDENEQDRRTSGQFFSILTRLQHHRDFFDRALKLQIRCGALFGQQAEDSLLSIQKARRKVEVSAGILVREPVPTAKTASNMKTWAICLNGEMRRIQMRPVPVRGRDFSWSVRRSAEAVA